MHRVYGDNFNIFVNQGEPVFMDLQPNMEYDFFCPDCNHTNEECVEKRSVEIFKSLSITYKLNNHKFRCDDFSKEFTTDNFLFSGCSYTFGLAIPYEMTWGHQLNSMLGMNKFFNVAFPANNQLITIANIFEYIKAYGRPKGIFMLLPDYFRRSTFYYRENGKDGKYLHTMGEWSHSKINEYKLDLYTNILMLEEYCNSLSIPLIWGVWLGKTNEDIKKDIVPYCSNYIDISFNSFDFNEMDEYARGVTKNYFWEKARDNKHLGGKYHNWWAHQFKKEWDRKYAETHK